MLQHFKQFYEIEDKRKDELNKKVSTILLFVSLYIAGLKYLFDLRSKNLFPFYYLWTFKFLILISLITFCISLYYAFKSVYGYEYCYVGADEISRYYDDLKIYFDLYYDEYFKDKFSSKEEAISNRLDGQLIALYQISATNNWLNNKRKIKNYTYFSFLILASVGFIALNILFIYLEILF